VIRLEIAMPLLITTAEGLRIEAEDALDALRKMNARSLLPEPDAWRYMLAVSSRVRRATGQAVRCDSPARLVTSLFAVETTRGGRRIARHGEIA
jgi:hypothetical protein